LYQGRFGIETSYRCVGRVRGWTTAKNPAYRFVLIALAFVLLNVWIHLRWILTQVPRPGRRWLDTERFQLARFSTFIRRALEQCYGCIQTVAAPAVPRCLEFGSTESLCHRPQLRLHLQGQSRQGTRRKSGDGRAVCLRRQRAQIQQPSPDNGTVDRRYNRRTSVVRALRPESERHLCPAR